MKDLYEILGIGRNADEKEIKKAFDEAKIKIPYTQIEVHNGK